MELEQIVQAILSGEQAETVELTRAALSQGVDADTVVENAFIHAMDIVGERFSRSEIYVPEMLRSARAMKAGMAVVKPSYSGAKREPLGRVLVCTVKGDLHDIGKNLVAMMVEGAGYEVVDLGVDVDPEMVLRKVADDRPDFLAMSALLTTTMISMEKTLAALVRAGIRDRVKVLVGGAPITHQFAESIGADGYGKDAGEAVKLIRRLSDRA